MINKYAADLAAQMGLELSNVSVVDGRTIGCLDAYLLHLTCKEQLVSVLVQQSDVDSLEHGLSSDSLNLRIRNALTRLKMLLQP